MNKLTAEKCRDQIAEWERMMSVSDIAVIVERHLQAYRIALPILEQHKVDSEALAVSREIMKIMYGPMPLGGSVQLMAQVQCLVIDAMKVAQGDNSLSRQPEQPTNQNGEQ